MEAFSRLFERYLSGDIIIMKKIVIVGAGGHAKVIVDMIQQQGVYDVVGLVDKKGVQGFWGLSVIGEDCDLPMIFKSGVDYAFIALGSNLLRCKLSSTVRHIGFHIPNIISNDAKISKRSKLGEGIAIMPGAIINADTTINDGCIINTNASIDHEGYLEPFVHIAPGCSLSGKVKIGRNSFIGTGARIIDGVSVGTNVIAGAGTVIIHDVEDNCTVVGVPAKKIK